MAADTINFVLKNDAGATLFTFPLPLNKLDATAAPAVTDDDAAGYVAGSLWVDRTNDKVYVCRDNATAAALWSEIPGAGGITSLNALTGAAQTFVDDTNVTIVSAGTTHTVTWAGTLADGRIASAATWNAKQPAGDYITALTGDVTAAGPGSAAATIANDAVTNAKLANAAAWTVKLRNAGTTGDLSDAALADITTEGSPVAGDFVLGFLDTGEIRKFDVSTLTGGGGGGTVGGTGTDNHVARWNGTDDIQDSGIIVDDADNVTGMATLTLPNAGLHILDTNASHDLIVVPGSDLTADRTLTITTGDADRTLTFTADATIGGTHSGSSSGTNTGDQNLFSTIAVAGQSDVVADGTGDTLTLVGSGVTITTDAATDTITFAVSSITSLNGETGATQTFAKVDDTNVTLTIGSAADVHTFTLGWAGTLADGRIASAATWNAKQPAGDYITALTGDVTAAGPGSAAATIANDAVTNAKLANAAAWTVKLRNAGTTGDLSDAALADITTEGSPVAGDFVLGFLDTGEIRKFDVSTLGSGGTPTAITVADTTDATCFVAMFESATGDLGPKTDGGLTYNAATGMLTATGLTGPLTGNASTATALQNARTIGGTSFDGTANIVPATITVADTTDATCFVAMFESATGDLAPKTDGGLTYDATTGGLYASVVTATSFYGNLTGIASAAAEIYVTNDTTTLGTFYPLFAGAISGPAQAAKAASTKLTFNPSTGTLTATAFSGPLTGNVTGNASTVTVADAGADTTTWVLLGTSQTGSLAPATDAGLTYDASTNALTATTFVGALTGNASTVTVADAGADTTTWVLLGTSQTGSLAPATDAGLTFNASTNALTATTFVGALTGNASTATALATPRNINGVAFDGTANITVTAAGSTLSDTVTVANGGTSLTTLTANNVILGNGTSAPTFVAPSTTGNVLTSNGTTWTSAAPAGGSVNSSQVISNLTIAATVAANALTIAIKTQDGGDPAAADAAKVPFRNATAATGDYTTLSIEAATSLVVSSGSTLGTTNSTAFKLWVVGFNDGGTFRIGVVNCLSAKNVMALRDNILASSTAEGGAGGADSAHVIYTGSAVTTKAMRVLACLEWSSGLATAGTWSSGPTKIQLYGPGIPLPGDTVQVTRTDDGAFATGSTVMPLDDTIPQNTEGNQVLSRTITPKSVANIISIETIPWIWSSVYWMSAALFIDATANALCSVFLYGPGGTFPLPMSWLHVTTGTAELTFKVRAGAYAGSIAINGTTSAVGGGTFNSFIECREIQA